MSAPDVDPTPAGIAALMAAIADPQDPGDAIDQLTGHLLDEYDLGVDGPTGERLGAFLCGLVDQLVEREVNRAVTTERANYEGAMADMHALVEVARGVTEAKRQTRLMVAVGVLERFLDANYPKEADRG